MYGIVYCAECFRVYFILYCCTVQCTATVSHLEGVQAGEEGGEVGAGDPGQDQGGGVTLAQGQEAGAHQGAAAAEHHAVT